MSRFSIGVMVDSFRLSLEEGIAKAKEVGATVIQIYEKSGEMAPENLSPAEGKKFWTLLDPMVWWFLPYAGIWEGTDLP